MLNWFSRLAMSDRMRIENNITRLISLQSMVHDLAFFAVASQSGGWQALNSLLEDRTILGRPKVHQKLKSALIGENNQKLVLDAPTKFQGIMLEAEELIKKEVIIEKRKLKELLGDEYEEQKIGT
jgi:hypothetical protein